MGLQLTLAGGILLLVAGFELWRLLVCSVFKLIVKAGLLKNISADPHTKISVVTATIKISLWTQLWKFLCAPTKEKLLVLTVSSAHLLVVKSAAEPTKATQRQEGSASPSLWQTLDTSIGLKDIQHPIWNGVRAWFPRLMFLFRSLHAVEVGVDSLFVEILQQDEDEVTPMLSIKHGSVFINAALDTKNNELSCTLTLSRTESMQVIVQGINATAVLGRTEVNVRVPICHDHEDLRAPIPSAYSVNIDSIQVNLHLEQTIQAALWPKQQKFNGEPSDVSYTTADSNTTEGLCLRQVLTVLRLAELIPEDFRCELRKLEVNVVDKRSPGSLCALELNGVSVVLSGDSTDNQEFGVVKSDYPVVVRKAELALGVLTLCLSEADSVNIVPPMVKLNGLKLNAEGTLSANAGSGCCSDELDEDGACLSFRSTISGGSRGLNVVISKRLAPWITSSCMTYDNTVKLQASSPPIQNLLEAPEVEEWSVMNYCKIDLDAHFKLAKTEVLLLSLDRTCDVLPKGVPSICLVLGEISVYAHPFVNEDHLGVRAKADIQCSRLKVFYFSSNDLVKSPFLSLDFVRVFIFPVETMMQSEVSADVEMEAEWVEVKWAPEVLHAIGGALELGIFTMASFLHGSRYPAPETKDKAVNCGWKASSSSRVPPMRQMIDVTQDRISPGEVIAFRCVAKRLCAIFPYVYRGQRRVDCVTVDTFTVSSEATTGRLRISIMDARAFPGQRSSDDIQPKQQPSRPAQLHRKSFTSRSLRSRTVRRNEAAMGKSGAPSDFDATYFVADCFSLEENQIAGSLKTVVDLFVNGVQLEWDISTQLRIMELVRRITYSSWEMIYRARSAYAVYCTPSDSIYNRVHGLNPPLNDIAECLRYERLFADLISASGDKLHRLHATNLSVNANLCDEVGVQLTVGVFAGDDLPEVWLFEDISIKVNAFEMAAVGCVRVRHTIASQKDYVFGEFEDMLRKRLLACKRSTTGLDETLDDGILVEINKLHLRTSRDFPLQAHTNAIQSHFDPFKEQLGSAASSYWRPQQEVFYQFFLRTSVASHQPELWLRLEDIGFECLGNPLDSWLERMYPVWIGELAEQELRSHILDEHVSTLKLTNAELVGDASYKEMEALLVEKNARLYIQKVKKLEHETLDSDNGPLINVRVGHLDVDVSFEEDIAASWGSIRSLDEATEVLENELKTAGRDVASFTPSCQLFIGLKMKTVVTELAVRMRRFPTPLMTCDCLSVEGEVFVTAFNSVCAITDLMAAIRCFVNLSIDVISPVLYFNPGYLYALDELSELALGFLPLAVPEVDRRFRTPLVDIVRRLLHGRIGVTVKNAGVRLLCAATSFDSADYLEVNVHRVRVAYSSGLIDIEVTRVAARIEPGSLSHIAELSHLKLQVWMKWDCQSDPMMHYLYPIEFVSADNTDERFVLNLPSPTEIPPSETDSTNPFQVYQATKLSIFIKGTICPPDPENGDVNDGWSKRDMAARTAVVLYSKSVEWLIGFGRVYQKIPQYPLPRRRDNTGVRFVYPSTDILSILEGVTIEEFDLIGLDVALYASEKNSVGVRAFLDDEISCSGALLKRSHNVFAAKEINNSDASEAESSSEARRLSFNIEEWMWIVHDVNVDARDIQVRVCTPESGSRGESLVSIKHVSLIVGGGPERAPTHDNSLMKLHSPPPMKRNTNAQPFSFSQATTAVEVKERSKQSILEYFDIPHENPFSYRESDSDKEEELDITEATVAESEVEECQSQVLDEFRRAGFLLGLLSKDVRVTITMVALESLVDIADTWVQVITTSLPELFVDATETAALLKKNEKETEEPDNTVEESDNSPKKFTSLAQDPKFSGICLQGGADAPVSPHNHPFEPTPYSNADSVRPVRKKSSLVVSQLERIRSKEETSPPRPTNAKLVQAFIMVKFEDCQISVQDQLHKGSVLLALNSGTLQHAVSSDSGHERIDLNVDGFQVFTAPLDVDVKSHAVWLKALADASYCPSSYGLLRQVIAPIPAQVTIWVDREKNVVKNKVKLDIPTIEVQVNLASKSILEKLTTTATELVNAKLAEKKSHDRSHLLHSYQREAQHRGRSLHQLLALKKQLKWKIAALEWRQMCGWDYRMNERAMAAVSATESARSLPFELETLPLFQRRSMSSASVSSVATNFSLMGSTATKYYEDEQFTDELQQMTQQFEILTELTHLMAIELQKQLKPGPLLNLDIEFTLDRASLTLSGENVDIIRAQVGSLSFKMLLLEDHSGKFALTLQDLSVKNLSPATPYPDMLLPVYSQAWEGDDMFFRVDAEIAKPVGGITVVQHFEINVHPIQVCITQEVIMQLVTFFSPPDASNSTKDVQREEVRSQFLQVRTSSSSSDGRVGSAIIKAVKVAGKAAAHPLSLGRTHRDEELLSSGRKAKRGALHQVPEDPTQWIAKLANLSEGNELPFFNSTDEAEQHQSESAEREVKDRAKNGILFKRIRLGAVEVVLTYRHKKSNLGNSSTPHLHLPHASQPQALEDMRGFEVKTRALVYCDKTCSPLDLLLRIRRDILLDVLSQVGRNFTNIGNFLRDQFDTSRWAAFDALAPLKSLSTTVSSLTASGPSHTGAVAPLALQSEASVASSEGKIKDSEDTSRTSSGTSFRPTELLNARSGSASSDHYDADTSAPSTPTSAGSAHPKQAKAKRSLAKLFSRKKLPSSPLPSPQADL
ncbi:Golgi-body localization protein domain [Phytophthora infestans]|uniref:Golgi-body localization protein domain n=1 Tax=Phytophthora infestans TaxID=4787 RepID=A0A833STP6_PHYIN|nr:Golgi-body localization protein domain [Phytophthora infestans]